MRFCDEVKQEPTLSGLKRKYDLAESACTVAVTTTATTAAASVRAVEYRDFGKSMRMLLNMKN